MPEISSQSKDWTAQICAMPTQEAVDFPLEAARSIRVLLVQTVKSRHPDRVFKTRTLTIDSHVIKAMQALKIPGAESLSTIEDEHTVFQVIRKS